MTVQRDDDRHNQHPTCRDEELPTICSIINAAAEAFLAKHLGGRAEPPSEKEKFEEFLK